jgi:hypothetical protein
MAKRKAYLGGNDPADPNPTAETAAQDEVAEGNEGQDIVEEEDRPASKFVDADGRRIGKGSLVGSLSEDLADPDSEAAKHAASIGMSTDGIVDHTRLADPHSEGDVPLEAKPKLGVRLDHYTPEEAERVDARERRIHDYNALAKAEGRPQAVTKEEMDLIP